MWKNALWDYIDGGKLHMTAWVSGIKGTEAVR